MNRSWGLPFVCSYYRGLWIHDLDSSIYNQDRNSSHFTTNLSLPSHTIIPSLDTYAFNRRKSCLGADLFELFKLSIHGKLRKMQPVRHSLSIPITCRDRSHRGSLANAIPLILLYLHLPTIRCFNRISAPSFAFDAGGISLLQTITQRPYKELRFLSRVARAYLVLKIGD